MRSPQDEEVLREFVGSESTNMLVEGDQNGILTDGEAEQERVGDLAVAV